MKPSNRMQIAAIAATFVIGSLVLLILDSTLARVVGMTLLFAFTAIALVTVATPEFLEGDDPHDSGD